MKKVLFVASTTSHINAFHIPYLKMFKDRGYEVHVASKGKEKIECCDKRFELKFERSPLKLQNIKVYKELKKIIDENDYEIIHCHTPVASVLTRLAAKVARKNGTRVIYTAHGFHFYKGAPLKNWLMFYPVEWYLAKYTDTLITINNEDFERAKKKFSKRCKDIQYVPGVGLDTTKFDVEITEDEQEKLRKKIGITKENIVLTFVGEINKNKNQIMLIKVIQDLVKENDKYRLLLVGDGVLKNKLEKYVEENKLEKYVKFLSYRKDTPQILKITNIYVAPSLREGLPVNVIEAMYMGLPVIAMDNRGHRELVDKGNIIYDYYELIDRIFTIQIEKNEKDIKKYLLKEVKKEMEKIYLKSKKELIIPICCDSNRGDQALVLETANIIKKNIHESNIYVLCDEEENVIQLKEMGLKCVTTILKHPSRKNSSKNINYNWIIKMQWGVTACFDFIYSWIILNKVTRKLFSFAIRKEDKETLKLFEESDGCFVKGGGFIHNYKEGLVGLYTMYFQMYNILLANSFNKPVYIMPNSFGPINGKITRKLVSNALRKCDLITARESISSDSNFNGLGMNIDLKPDLGFFLESEHTKLVDEILKSNGIDFSKKKYVGITVRPYRFPKSNNPKEQYIKYKKTIIDFVHYLNTLNYVPLFIVQTYSKTKHEDDETCINEIIENIDKSQYKTILSHELNCKELKYIYGQCKYVVGTRFHSVIFAISQKIPCIAITYGGNKGNGIMKDMRLEDYKIDIENLQFELLKNKFEKLEINTEEIKNIIGLYLKKADKSYLDLNKNIERLVKK